MLAAVYWAFGTSLGAQRAVGYLQHLGVVVRRLVAPAPVGPVGRRHGRDRGGHRDHPARAASSALAWIGAVALGLWSIRAGVEALRRPSAARGAARRLIWIAGLLGGAALLYRLDLVVAMVAVARRRAVAPAAARTAGASCSPRWPGSRPTSSTSPPPGPGDVVRGHGDRAGVRAPRRPGPAAPAERARLRRVPPAGRHPRRAAVAASRRPPGPIQLGLWLLLCSPGARSSSSPGAAARRDGRPRLLVMAAFATGLLPQALQRADSTHLAWVSCVTLAFLPAAVVELWPLAPSATRARRRAPSPPSPCRPCACSSLVPHFTLRTYAEAAGQTFGYRHNALSMTYDGRVFRYARPDAVDAVNALLPLVDELTEPGDRLFVGPGRPPPHARTARRSSTTCSPTSCPATRYIEMDPGVANAEDSGLADELAVGGRGHPVVDPGRLERTERLACSTAPTSPTRCWPRTSAWSRRTARGCSVAGLYEVYRRC